MGYMLNIVKANGTRVNAFIRKRYNWVVTLIRISQNDERNQAMNINIEELKIINNQAENRFEVWIEKQLSKMDYIKDGKTIVLTHVGVHPMHRGQGVAAKL